MSVSIHCRELGIDCQYEVKGETEDAVLDLVLSHVHSEHPEKIEDWFDTEEIYQSALKAIREKAA